MKGQFVRWIDERFASVGCTVVTKGPVPLAVNCTTDDWQLGSTTHATWQKVAVGGGGCSAGR